MGSNQKTRKTRKTTTAIRPKFQDTLSEQISAPSFFWLASLQMAAFQNPVCLNLIAHYPRRRRS